MRSPRQRAPLDVYRILGADRDTTWSELRRRYRARARELHPDVQAHRPGTTRLDPARATAAFTRLQAAWSLVATPERKQAYDRAHAVWAERPKPRPPRVPRWPQGPQAAVLLRTGPGEFHIAVPGGAWNLSLSQFHTWAQRRSGRALLIGDLPPHPDLRRALQGVDFVERHRLTTMVGWSHEDEDRLGFGRDHDDEGAWKVGHLASALAHWGRIFPARARELPYGPELLLLGQLSLAGYEINLPHPAGLYQLVEGRAPDRVQARERLRLPVLELRLPPPSLLLAAAWAGDLEAVAELGQGWERLLHRLGGEPEAAAALQRAVEGRRHRQDGYDALPGSALQRGRVPPALQHLLERWPKTRAWLEEDARLPRDLPWGAPLSRSGSDHDLGDAAARLVARWLRRLWEEMPDGVSLVALRGSRLRLRLPPAGAEVAAELRRRADFLGSALKP